MTIARQVGQSMVEYLIVTAALVTAFFVTANTDCPGYDNCVSKLLTVMHDKYDGYSASISAVQKYGEYEADTSSSGGGSDSGGSGGNDGGSGGDSGGISLDPDGLTEVSQVTGNNGLTNWGYLNADGSVTDADGNIVGYYSEADGTLTTVDGDTYSVGVNSVVLDEEGNVLHLRAITSCSGDEVYGWGYVSKASGKVFNSVTRSEMDIGSLCTQPSFKVVENGVEQGGRILNGEYYASVYTVTVGSTAETPAGEVIYWEDLGICSVMAVGWDDEVDTGLSDEEYYAEQLALFNDPDSNLGQMDSTDYFEQTAIYGVATEPNDCPSARVLVQP